MKESIEEMGEKIYKLSQTSNLAFSQDYSDTKCAVLSTD